MVGILFMLHAPYNFYNLAQEATLSNFAYIRNSGPAKFLSIHIFYLSFWTRFNCQCTNLLAKKIVCKIDKRKLNIFSRWSKLPKKSNCADDSDKGCDVFDPSPLFFPSQHASNVKVGMTGIRPTEILACVGCGAQQGELTLGGGTRNTFVRQEDMASLNLESEVWTSIYVRT